jgi:DNA polymerase-3 subunit beta
MGGGIASMKALCNREGLLDAFSKVSGVGPARSPKPILQNVKLVADPEDGSILMATDLEVGIRCRVLGVKVDQPGAVILPTQRMQSILRALSDEELAIETDGDQLVVRGLHAEYKLPSEAPDLFPEIPDFAATAYHAIAAADLRRLIRRTMFATDVESTRYALGGVLVELKPDSVTMVGTDGRRLAHQVAEAQAEGGAEAPPGNPVIPVKALKLIERNLDDTDPPVHLAIQGGAAALIRTDRAVIYCRLVEGRFPRYQDVFPASVEVKVPFQEIGPLLSAVEQASIVTSEETRVVEFTYAEG